MRSPFLAILFLVWPVPALANAGALVRTVETLRHLNRAPSGLIQCAAPAPELDKLFRANERWLGGDVVSSIPIGRGKTIWLFGDTFFDQRTGYNIVHNTIGLQTADDPVAFYWRNTSGPEAIFPSASKEIFQWPTQGIEVEGRVTVFPMLAQRNPANEEFPIRIAGSHAVVIDNVHAGPELWTMQSVSLPFANQLTVGSGGLLRWERHVYAYSVEPLTLDVVLLRWPEADFAATRLDRPQFYTDAGEWSLQRANAVPILKNAQAEFDVYFDETLDQFVQIETVAAGNAQAADLFGKTGEVFVAARFADRPEGPWSLPVSLFKPELPDKAFAYAAKAHPHLSKDDLIISFVPNTKNLDSLLAEGSPWYYPQFIRIPRWRLRMLRSTGTAPPEIKPVHGP